MLDTFFNFQSPANGAPITTTSVTIHFNLAPTYSATAPFNYMMETNIANPNGSNGTTFYAALQGYGVQADNTTRAAGQGIFALWNANPSDAVAGTGSLAASFANEGTGAHITHPLGVATGVTYVLTTTLSNNILTETMTNPATGISTIIGAFINVNATSLVNSMALVVEDFGDTTAAQINGSQNTNVTYSNFTVNGVSTPMAFTGTANPSSNPFLYCQEAGTNFYQCAAGGTGGLNEVQLGVANATIQGAGANAAIQATATFHSLIGDTLTGVPILDMAGQVVQMTVVQYRAFTSVVNSAGGTVGAVFANGGTVTAVAAVNNYALNGSNIFTAVKLTSGTYGIIGGTGNDTFNVNGAGMASGSAISGGGGIDVVVFSGARSAYATNVQSNGSVIVTETGGNQADGTVSLLGITNIQFADKTISVASLSAPPTVSNQTATQNWTIGQSIALLLPANTFSDPNGQSMTYGATQANGVSLPSWLQFNSASETFSGTVPVGAASLTLKVSATDTSGLIGSETFQAQISAQSSVTNTTGSRATLVAPNANTTVQGAGFDSLDLSQNAIAKASSAYTITSNNDGSFTLATAGSSDHVSRVMQVQFADKTLTVGSTNTTNAALATTAVTEQVALLYQATLGRSPDAAGLAGWVQTYTGAGQTAAAGVYNLSNTTLSGFGHDLVYGFTSSPEFQAKYGTLTNTQFVTQLYANVLDRTPDTAGLNSWVNALASGSTRDAVVIGFAESAEATSNATQGYTGQSGAHASWLVLI